MIDIYEHEGSRALAIALASAYPNGPARLSPGRPRGATPVFVVFDIGNVLVRWNPRNLFRKTMQDDARMERFLAAALSMDFVSLTDIAADFSKAVKERAKAFPEFAHELHLFDERWVETIGGPIEENVALLRRLKAAGRPVYALSNFATVKFAIARGVYDFLSEFDETVISGHVGVVKPDPRIYEILFERVGRQPQELVFVDDQIKNIEAARALGMDAIHFGSGVDLERELKARGALP
jgi:2-haloacid dehalogenase